MRAIAILLFAGLIVGMRVALVERGM